MKKARTILVSSLAFILVGTVAFKRIVRSASANSVMFASSATISGQVFNDKNGNGVKEAPAPPAPPGDTGLPGWTIQILDTNNQVLASQITDANGNYSITLPPVPVGSITVKVREVVQAGWVQTTPNPTDITVTTSGGTFSGRDFGNFQRISISGQVYNDLNGNGSLGAGENVLAGWTVFLDTNGNGALDNGEVSTVTSPSGNYSFANLGPGTYKVREVVQNGWMQTSANPVDIAASSGANVDAAINPGLNFGNFQKTSISGQVYNDVNGNGVREPGDNGLPGRTIFLDTNGNGALENGEPSAVTDTQGSYSFTNLGPGAYKLREVAPIGWIQTTANPPDITASSGTNVDGTTNTALNFGNFLRATISGKVFEDLNGNGVLDAGEPGLSGWTVQLDTNNNHQVDSGEPFLFTDAQGNYIFSNLGPGTFGLLFEIRNGWRATQQGFQTAVTASGSNSTVNAGRFKNAVISGTVYLDQNGNGARDAGEPGQSGWQVQLLDTSNQILGVTITTADGSYSFNSQPPGTCRIREVVQAGWAQTTTLPADITVTTSGTNLTGVDFGDFQKISISGHVYNDRNGNGAIDSGDPGLSPWTVFLDSNSNGALDNGESSTLTNQQGDYTFANLGPGTYKVRQRALTDYSQTTANPLDIVAVSGNSVDATANPGLNIGLFQKATVSGKIFEDTNGNGVPDAGEPGLSGWTVFLDANSNGVIDAGELFTSTDTDGNYHFDVNTSGTFRLQEVLPAGWSSESIASLPLLSGTNAHVNLGEFKHGSITGTVFNDLNGNGARDAGESGLGGWTIQLMNTANTVLGSTSTAADGSYSLTIQTAGPKQYRIREVVQTGFTQTTTTPADIVPTSGMNQSGVDFGTFKQVNISGQVFKDLNASGSRDSGEPGLSGWTVFLDINNNGIADAGEASVTTDASGNYSFANVAAGQITVREVVQSGWSATTNGGALPVTIVSGVDQTINFGNSQQSVIQFSQPNYTVVERGGSIQITVTRTGETSGAVSVDYATDDGSTPSVAIPCAAVSGRALERCDYTRSAGTLSFAPGETQKSFIVLVNDDSYTEGPETLQLVLSNPLAANLGPQATAILQINDDATESSGNPLEDPSFFIRQHYHDFLNREPDQSGLDFWTGSFTSCGSDAGCREVVRINDSAAFFLSIEFQQTGYLVERLYKVGYGDATGNSTFPAPHTLPVPVVRLREFLRDTQQIGQGVVVGAAGWDQLLETNKQAFVTEFVSRQRFTNAFPPTLNAQQFVTQLDQNAGQVLTDVDKTQLMGIFGGPSASSNDAAKRGVALRQVAENTVLQQREFNRAFVLMQFFGYLRRNPDDAQDTDYTGFDFWLTKLNQFNGDFIQAEMVKAFITSAEYRQRFGQQ